MNIIRKNTVAGSFYPRDPETLSGQIEGFLSNVQPSGLSNIKAVVSPHAGYAYSGQVAAYSFRQLQKIKYDSIIIIAPSHAEYFDFVSVYHGDVYETPLGHVVVDRKRVDRLEGSSPVIRKTHSGHNNEHSLEVQLPFLQVVLGSDIRIVPVVIGNQSRRNITILGQVLGELFADENILVVASTDLSHYHPYDDAISIDNYVKDIIELFDSQKLINSIERNDVEMCGSGPVASAMIASKLMGADSSAVLKYATSGDVSGDMSAVVGYLSAAFYKK